MGRKRAAVPPDRDPPGREPQDRNPQDRDPPDCRQAPAYLSALNPTQAEAVLHFGPPLLILAGAGSGKTRVITTKIAWLADCRGFDPRSILAVTFTNKAADEMRERVHALALGAQGVMIRTFHSFGAWLLRRNAELAGLTPHFSIYDDEDARSLLKGLLGANTPAERIVELARWIERAKERGLGPGDDLDGICLDPSFPEIYRGYQERLRASGAADFGDLILQSVRLLRDHPEVRQRIRQRFRAVLVDEFQDSNGAQLELLLQLYDGSNYLCVVGDEDQSIYGFRGAELRNILDFPKLFPGTEIVRMEENYRSTQNILKAAAGVVAHNLQRLGKTLFTRQGSGSPVLLAHLDDQDREAEFCADLLRAEAIGPEAGGQEAGGPEAGDEGGYGETAILYRMNFQSRTFENLFTRLGIPYRVVGTLRFYEREEIKDALAYLFLLLNGRDEVAFQRATAKPRRGIGAKTLEKVLQRSRGTGEDLLVAGRRVLAGLPKKSAQGLADFLALMDSLGGGLQEAGSLAPVVSRLILDSGLYRAYGARDQAEGRAGGNPRVKNLEELVSGTLDYPGGRDGLAQFLENVELGALGENPYQRTGRVTLITVHNTKGLEFDRVIITGLEEGIFPITTGMDPDGAAEDLEEERRLFYVGVTRARRRLVLTTCRQRRIFGRQTPREPSRFLKEIPADTLEVTGERSAAAEAGADRFPPGAAVYHEDYGPGIVTRRWTEEGEPMVIIRFQNGKSGRFFLRYTPLERLAPDD
jgi:DNA helicase-2/ATP-dependent DNA helicase PcrA